MGDVFQGESEALEILGVGVVLYDGLGAVRAINDRALAMLGIDRDSVLGKRSNRAHEVFSADGALLEPDDWPIFKALRHGEETQGRVIGFVNRQTGACNWVSVSVTLRGFGELPPEQVRVCATLTDVHDVQSRLAEGLAQARANRVQLERVLAAVPGVVFQVALSEDDQAELRFVSGRALEVLGESPETLMSGGRKRFLNYHPDDAQRVADSVRSAIADGQPIDYRARFRCARGEYRHGHVRAVCEVHSMERILTGVLFDVTDETLLEQRLNRSQRLELLGELAGGVAHNFNNLLAAILPNLEFALPEAAGPARESLEDALRAAQGASEVVRQMLSLGAREAQESDGVTDLADVVRRAARICRASYPATVRLQVNGDHFPVLIRGPSRDLEQVVINLLLNARDAVRNVEAPLVDLRLSEEEKVAVLSVSDNGCGMTRETVERLGEPFFTTKGALGTGLGLPMVLRTLRQIGARYQITTEEGQGALFRLEFTKIPDKRVTPPPPSEPFAAEGEVVLVVEDDALVRRVLVKQLQRGGFRTFEAQNGEEALDVLGGLSPDELADVRLICMDLMMPVMNGRTLLTHLEARFPAIPALILSGNVESREDLHHARRILEKPLTGEALLSAVREVLGRSEFAEL